MKLLNQKRLRSISLITVIMFILATFGSQVQATEVTIPTSGNQSIDLSIIGNVLPELNTLQSSLRTAQSTLSSLESVSTPIYNSIAPSNMEAMSISQRLKAIAGNAKSLLGNTFKSSGSEAKTLINSGASISDLTVDQQLAYGVEQLGIQASKLESNSGFVYETSKIKAILDNIKNIMNRVVTAIRAKIFAVGQKVGLISKDKSFEDGKITDNGKNSETGKEIMVQASGEVQYADSFVGKVAKGVAEGTQNAKASLKNSFSFSNLAITTTVAIGTNLAIDMIHGQKPSFKEAVKSVANLEFAGSVVGSALGAAGGQLTASVIKSIIPGPIGALVGSVIPVMFSSATGQMSSNLISGIKNGEFSISKAWKAVDKTDLLGSSIGSTIGMALGAPIPIIGPIIGGIVGGFLGSKIAKLVENCVRSRSITALWNKGSSVGDNSGNNSGNITQTYHPVTIGNIAGTSGGNGPVTLDASSPTFSASSITPSGNAAAQLENVEKQYYDSYMQYNRMIEANDQEGAKKVFEQLKVYSDQYSALKQQLRTK